MKAMLLALVGLLLPAAARAQDSWELPVHAWIHTEAGNDAFRGQVGVAIPVRPEVAVVPAFVATDQWVELQAGATLEFGALYLMPLVGAERAHDGGSWGLAPQLHLVFEAPPLPVYIENWTRFGLRQPFDADAVLDDAWLTRTQLLGTFRPWLAAGLQIEAGGSLGGPLTSRPLGLRATVGQPGIGLGLFAGFETVAAAKDDALVPGAGLVGRLTLDLSW